MASKNDELIQKNLDTMDRLKAVAPLIAVAHKKGKFPDIDEALEIHVQSGREAGYLATMARQVLFIFNQFRFSLTCLIDTFLSCSS